MPGGLRIQISFLLATLFLLLIFFIDIATGSVNIPLTDIWNIIQNESISKSSWREIIIQFRLPKAITAVLAGTALSLSGLMMQTLFRNPVAGPYILGISSGASLGVAILVLGAGAIQIAWIDTLNTSGTWMMVISAIVGASVVMLGVIAVASRIKDVMTLLILGLMFGSMVTAFVGILQYFSSETMLKSFVIWTFGSLGGVAWLHMKVLIPVIMIGMLICILNIKNLNGLLLGESYARSLGIHIKRTRLLILLSTSILAGTITAFCGPIVFIGIAVPHLARILLDTNDHRFLVPAVIIIGSSLILLCDIFSQIPFGNEVLPINSVTALIGAPLVIWIVMRNRKIAQYF